MEKFNEELIRKELLNLSNHAIDEIIERLKTDKTFKFTDDDHNKDGTNWLDVRMKIENNMDDTIKVLWDDFYTKKQMTGKGMIDYKGSVQEADKSPLQMSEEIRAINQVPLKEEDIKLPEINPEYKVDRDIILHLINYLVLLDGYQDVYLKSVDKGIAELIGQLVGKLNKKNE